LEGTTFPRPLSGLCTNNRLSVPISEVTDILLLFAIVILFFQKMEEKPT
jgi:hypothetical protein